MPIFFLLIYILFFKILNKKDKLIIIILFFILIDITDYGNSNYHISQTLVLNTGVNSLLLNPINKYHPFILFTSFIILLKSVILRNALWFNFFTTEPNFKLFKNLSITKAQINTNIYTFIILYTALFLGSWWAFQEGSWGG